MDGDAAVPPVAPAKRTKLMTPMRLKVYRAVLAATADGARVAVGKLAVAGLTELQVSDLLLRCRDLGLIEAGPVAPGKASGGRRLEVKARLPGVGPLPDGEWALSAPERKPQAIEGGLWEWDDEGRRRAEMRSMNERFAAAVAPAGRFEDAGAAAASEGLHRAPPPVVASGCSSASSWSVSV